MPSDLSQTRRDLVRLLKKYVRAAEEERTPLLRQVGETLVDAREHFARADGSPDWNGRSYTYRTWVRDAFADAGVDKDSVPTIQAAIRYHIGGILRERLDEETLDDYGLIKRSPKERAQDRRAERTVIVQALQSRDLAGGALVALHAAHTVLSKVEPKDFDVLDGHAAEVAEATLNDLERRVKTFRKRIVARRSPAANGG